MMTYSLNIGLPTEAHVYDMGNTSSVDFLLQGLKDNEVKLVNPWHIRDAVVSLWANTPFKETKVSGSPKSYIGIDTGNPNISATQSLRDIKKKLLIGKRSFSGTYSYTNNHDILGITGSLLSSDAADIFLYNTKSDHLNQDFTRISILSDNDFSKHKDSPYLESRKVIGVTESNLSLNIINPSGNINISTSEYLGYTSSVFVNGVRFPRVTESTASASNNKVLFVNDNNELYWDDILGTSSGSVGVSGSQLNIYGNPINLNGFPLEFSDSRRCPVELGDIVYGDSFTDTPISEVLRRMVYNYLPPDCSIRIVGDFANGYSEVGTSPSPEIEYRITKRTYNTVTTGLSNMTPGSYPPIVSNSYEYIIGTAEGVVISPIGPTSTEFKITVGDTQSSCNSTTKITGIYPYFHGFNEYPNMNSIGLSTLEKTIESKGDKLFDFVGNGYMYFIYDFDYGTISNIYSGGINVSNSFTHSVNILSSPDGLWASKKFYVYRGQSQSNINPPSINFDFKY